MGIGNSNTIDQQNQTLHQHLKNIGVPNFHTYRFVQKRNDQSVIVQNIDKHNYYILRTITVTAEEDAISMARMMQKRNKIACIHLCKIISIKKQSQALTCSQIHKLHLFIQCPLKSLQSLLQQKTIKTTNSSHKKYFEQSQLWGIAYSVVKALKSLYLYGINHQSLSLECIFIDEKGLIKLGDPALFGLQKNYITAMKQKQNCQKILSPQILVFLDQYNFYYYQKQKSDIFILGILLIHLCNLKQFPIYDYKQKRQRFQLIQINLNTIKNRYSQRLYNVLVWMTEIQPKKRPRLNEIFDFIDKNNISDKSTSLTNTVIQTPNQFHHLSGQQKNLDRIKTVSAFSIQNKPTNNVAYSSTINLHSIPYNITNATTQNNNQILTHNTISNNTQPISSYNIQQNFTHNSSLTQKKQPLKERRQTQQSKNVFPFQLIYNRIINNNNNMKPFEIQNLYKQYKINDMFNSSCRGSIPTSSYHAQIQASSKQIPNKNLKILDAMAYSKNSAQKAQYLVYSQSSAFNASNKLSFSKNSLGDIKLVQSNHFKEIQQIKTPRHQSYYRISNIIQDMNEQTSIQSPYRKLTSHKNSEGKSLTSIKYLDMDPIINKQYEQLKHSDILQKYIEENRGMNLPPDQINAFQSRYFSQQQQKQLKITYIQPSLQTYKSQYLKGEAGSSKHLNDKKDNEYLQQQKYDKYLMQDKIINKQTQKYLSSKQRVDSSKNMSFQSSQLQSKISRTTPNFAQKSHKQTGSQKQSLLPEYNFLYQNELLFIENDINQEGSIYTGYKSKAGLKQRHGRLQFHDGGYYQGQWKNDKMEGYGELYYSNGALAYKGLWFEGCFSGTGQIFNDKPEEFIGPFNYRNFTQIQNRWLSYEGEFENDSKHGKGRINLTNGQYFQGTFDYDMIQGHGMFHTNSGQIIKGLWKDNELIQYQ